MYRVIVFIDYQNVFGWARRRYVGPNADPSQGHIFPFRAAEMIVNRRKQPSQLTQVRVYRGRPNPARQSGAARANDRQTADWARHSKVEVIRRNVQYPPNYPTAPAVEKGIDVAIAVDMINLAMTGAMDVAVLFSSDKDLMPAVEMLWNYKGCHVEVAAWTQANRLRFDGQQLPWCHNLNQSDFDSIRDWFDYSAP